MKEDFVVSTSAPLVQVSVSALRGDLLIAAIFSWVAALLFGVFGSLFEQRWAVSFSIFMGAIGFAFEAAGWRCLARQTMTALFASMGVEHTNGATVRVVKVETE